MKQYRILAAIVILLVTPLHASAPRDEQAAASQPRLHVVSRAVWNEPLRDGRDAKSQFSSGIRPRGGAGVSVRLVER